MPTYATIPTIAYKKCTYARPAELPEMVHLEDSVFSVMIDFYNVKPPIVYPETPIDEVLEEMKINNIHLMLVSDQNQNIIGLIGSEDILGEKPIKILEERRITREEITAKMVMTLQSDITAFDFDELTDMRVGNIVNTLKKMHRLHAVVIQNLENNQTIIRGLFSLPQISKQLHMDVGNNIWAAGSIAELQKRHR